MLASDLVGSGVFDSEGERIGHCYELEVQNGTWQLRGLMVGSLGALERLGFRYRDVRGPIGLRGLVLSRPSYRVTWDQLASVEHHTLRLNCPIGDLERL